MTAVQPFLATLPAVDDVQPLGRTLRDVGAPPATSPWSPRETPPSAPPPIDTQAIEEAARERGRQQGLAETAELRARLASAIDAFTRARDALREPAADQIAAAAAAIFAAWSERAAPRELYAPIVRAWVDKHAGPATVRVVPDHVADVQALLGDPAVTVTGDATLRPGDIELSASTLELSFDWQRELDSLRDAIAAALEEAR